MKSILREYIRAALVLNEEDGDYTTSSALISGLKTDAAQGMPPELAGLVAAANNVIEKNLEIYLADAQTEIDKLDTLSVLDMGQEDLTSIYRSISALLRLDASELTETHYPIRTALYLIALDENMPGVFESTSDFLLSIVSQLGEAMPGNSPDIQVPAQNENRSSAYSTISEGKIWDAIKYGAGWMTDKAVAAGTRGGGAAKTVSKVITAPSNTGYQKLARFIEQRLDKAIEEIPSTVKLNAGKVISKARESALAGKPGDELFSATIEYGTDDLKVVALDILEAMSKDSSKTVANLTDAEIETALRARLPDALDGLATNIRLVVYVKEAIRLADVATGSVPRYIANFGPVRFTFAIAALAATSVGAKATYDALKEAGTIAPNANISKTAFAALVSFEKLAAKGASAAKSVGSKLNNVDVYDSVIDFNTFGAAFATLIDCMLFNPLRNPVLQPAELEELSEKMSNAVARVTIEE